MMISVGRLRHLDTHSVEVEIDSDRTISDRAAITIASWWMSPATTDMPLATLAQRGEADRDELLDSIAINARQAGHPSDLAALHDWAVGQC